MHVFRYFASLLLFTVGAVLISAATPPAIGDRAPNFTLRTLDDQPIELKQLTARQRVVLVVLRGWPGYQCPLCTRQVIEFAGKAAAFDEQRARVVMVYPGPAEKLKSRAEEFLQNKDWPANFSFVLDPDYTFTNAYGLRWNAPKETAYPSTFVIDRDGRVRFAKTSRTHGGRASVQAVLDALDAAK